MDQEPTTPLPHRAPPRSIQDRLERGASFRVQAGWWSLLEQLDDELARVYPEYRITGIGSQMGMLSCEVEVEMEIPACCAELEARQPAGDEADLEEEEAWVREMEEHQAGASCTRAWLRGAKTREARISEMTRIIERYRSISADICEETGEPGVLCERFGQWRTLNVHTAQELGYRVL